MTNKARKQEFAVIGLGRFGSAVARRLEETGHTVLAIDANPALVQAISDEVTQAAALDATDVDALNTVDIASFDTVVLAMASHFEASALATSILKELGVRRVICEAQSQRHCELLLRVGADRVVQTSESAGRRLAEELVAPSLLEYLAVGARHSIAELVVPRQFVGKTVAECQLQDRYRVTLLLIRRDQDIRLTPPPETPLQAEDVLAVFGANDDVERLSHLE